MGLNFRIVEQDDSGRTYHTKIEGGKIFTNVEENREKARGVATKHIDTTLEFMSKVFLPAGYPNSVSPDYLRYQVLNALQAFCSSLATLISNRAVLEGMGVGDASATATNALLLTVLLDVFNRLTTIVGAYYFGSSLYPEAKLYRILADILNDAAILLDTISPILVHNPASSSRFNFPGARVAALCLSSALRSLCGIAAGGSKAAITLHFASPAGGKGDVGDLNAKDASKETVLALSGMLLGTVVVPYLTTAWTIYPVLLFMLSLHLLFNYMGVRGLVLRSLNRQRATTAWLAFSYSHSDPTRRKILSPDEVSHRERTFDTPCNLRDPGSGRLVGRCLIGSTLSGGPENLPTEWFSVPNEKYILARLPSHRHATGAEAPVDLRVFLRPGHTSLDHLKAWAHASEAAMLYAPLVSGSKEKQTGIRNTHETGTVFETAYHRVDESWDVWLKGLKDAGWNLDEGAIITGAPKTVVVECQGL
ncbi:hypothetical protein ONZ45_g12723 [Pleurotus djamor]|nr:hypothetical protein ONZ45_g12723 [Pleurotus djamor]